MVYFKTGAVISPDSRYRYMLMREWRDSARPSSHATEEHGSTPVVFIMLNPSTANAEEDDPTIRKCVGFARRWGYEKMIAINLFAYRATFPNELYNAHTVEGIDLLGPQYGDYLDMVFSEPAYVVAAWGNHGSLLNRNTIMMQHLRQREIKLWCLGVNRDGSPKHPLMPAYDVRRQRYDPL
jgi:hypothetical protein